MPVGQKWSFFCKDGMKLEDGTAELYVMQEVLTIQCLDGNTFDDPAAWPVCINGKGTRTLSSERQVLTVIVLGLL